MKIKLKKLIISMLIITLLPFVIVDTNKVHAEEPEENLETNTPVDTSTDTPTDTPEDTPAAQVVGPQLNVDVSNLEEGRVVVVDILLHNQENGIMAFSGYFHYNTDKFEEIRSEDITTTIDEDLVDSILYSSEREKITIIFDDYVQNIETLCTITLRLKETINVDDIYTLAFTLGKPSVYYEDSLEEQEYESHDILEIIKEEKLTLATNIYKIGNDQVRLYVDGDHYIAAISKETTKEAFIGNLITDGNIRIIKEDQTELGDDELVGTGMTLEVTKDDEKIELVIAVTGDLSGDGKVTATDLSTMNQVILKLLQVENEYFIAGDTDESNKITATDLSTVNQMLLKLI